MAITVRALLKSAAGLFAALLSHANASVVLASRRETPTMAAFIARLRQDLALRRRFADHPSAVLREYGIDPTPYRFPEQMSQAQLDRLLAQFAQAAPAPAPTEPPTDFGSQAPAPPSPPAVVYGPPARPPQPPHQSPPAPVYGPPARPPQSSPPPPPAPVYGPPAGPPR
jgi:hypothetical protein